MAHPSPSRSRRALRERRGILSNDFLIQVILLAIERWDRLSPEEQQRFRLLAKASRGNAKRNLDKHDFRELKEIWKKLEVRSLITEATRLRIRHARTSDHMLAGSAPDQDASSKGLA